MTSNPEEETARVAVVTGGAGALGSAIVRRLFADGLLVVVADRDTAASQALAADLDLTAVRSLGIAVDVTNYDSVAAMVEATIKWAGGIDVLINNAGISEGDVSSWEMPLSEWQRVIAVNLTGVFHGCRAVLPQMIRQRRGRIVNMSSIAGKEGKYNPVAYSAAKAGVIGLTKALAYEVAPFGVFVNAVTPGSIYTPNWATLPKSRLEVVARRHPLGRLGRPEEVAAMVAWLASDECSFSTGAVFDVSGGRAGY